MEQIKFLDLKPKGKVLSQIYYAFDRVYGSGIYIGGKEVEKFEKEWADYCNAEYCIGVGNGHDALALACRYIYEGYSPTRPPISVPWKTCLPTWSAVENGKCSPVPDKLGSDIKLAVHIYGNIELPNNYNPSELIEDCAQAHGATLQNRKAGSFGKIAAWSFYPTKNLGALGDAGAVTTEDESVAEYVRDMSHYGKPDYPGINSRLDPLQAAILSVKLKYLNEWNNRRRENASVYLDTIIKGSKIELPKANLFESCWHIFAIETDDRDGLRFFLKLRGIETMVHYWDVPYPPCWNIPEAERWTQRELSLPIAPHISERQCSYIGKLINEWMGA